MDYPVLQESLRYNLDPFNEHNDDRLWAALEEAQLASWVRGTSEDRRSIKH